MNVVCVGDCGVDHYLPSNDKLIGGITANFARHARSEFPADDAIHIISAVGDDDGASLVLSALEDSGIKCHISRLSGATPVQFIEVQPDGERNFVRYEAGVLGDFRIGDQERRIIQQSDLLVAPVYLQIVGLFDELMSIRTRGLTSIDFADFLQHPDFELLERHIDAIDIGFFGLSADDVAAIERIEDFAKKHDKLFVITLGADGSRACCGDRQFDCPADPVDKIVDTTGAGDAFAAGFLSRYCCGKDVSQSLISGAKLAATVVQRHGAI
jgi:sugar/nucleoside kinase (ribokinase family)